MHEQLLLEKLKGLRVEKIISFDLTNKNIIKFTHEIGPSLKDIFLTLNNNFSVKSICNIGLFMVLNKLKFK